MKEEWLFRGALVPIDAATTASLVAKIKRLIDVVGGMALAQPFNPDYDTGAVLVEEMQRMAKRIEDLEVEHEPVAWMTINEYGEEDDIHYENPEGHLLEGWTYKPLYTHPPKTQQAQSEPLEFWNAVEGWVKIEEVREHFESVGCGTIYKTAGEDRTPLYTSPPKREWVGLTDEDMDCLFPHGSSVWVQETVKIIEAKLKDKNT
jgi:hypothetical protein